MYQLSYKSCGNDHFTDPRPTLGLALKQFFDLQANYRLHLDWITPSMDSSFFASWMWFDSSSDRQEGRFKIKLIEVGDEVFILDKNPEENGGKMEDIAKLLNAADVNTTFDIHVVALQLQKIAPVNFEGGL